MASRKNLSALPLRNFFHVYIIKLLLLLLLNFLRKSTYKSLLRGIFRMYFLHDVRYLSSEKGGVTPYIRLQDTTWIP